MREAAVEMPGETTQRSVIGIALTAAAAAMLTACSSSSSGGGPNPQQTAHAVPTETFNNVSPKANRLIQKTLPLMRGVATDTYQNGALLVIYTRTATKSDQVNVENIVHQAETQAAPPTPTKRAGASKHHHHAAGSTGSSGSTGSTGGAGTKPQATASAAPTVTTNTTRPTNLPVHMGTATPSPNPKG